MAGFFVASKQSCDIIIPFVDTLIADIHPIFANKYLHKVDSDEILICEVHKIDKNISEVFAGDLHTPKADEVLDSMCWDQNGNICVTVDVKGEHHKITTNFKKSRKYSSVDVVKDDLRRIRHEIRMCISDNVTDFRKF